MYIHYFGAPRERGALRAARYVRYVSYGTVFTSILFCSNEFALKQPFKTQQNILCPGYFTSTAYCHKLKLIIMTTKAATISRLIAD